VGKVCKGRNNAKVGLKNTDNINIPGLYSLYFLNLFLIIIDIQKPDGGNSPFFKYLRERYINEVI
jgi:hypothetical protein